MRTTLNLNAVRKASEEAEENLEVRLGRLAATCKDAMRAVTEVQKYWYERATVPYDGMDAKSAFITFAQLVKTWTNSNRVGNSLAVIIEKSSVTLHQSNVVVHKPEAAGYKPVVPTIEIKKKGKQEVKPELIPGDTITIPIVGGNIKDALTKDQMMARDVSNILSLYTSCEKVMSTMTHTEIPAVTALKIDQCRAASIYAMDLKPVREYWPVIGPSNVETRNDMFMDLNAGINSPNVNEVNKTRATIYCLMDMIATRSRVRVPMPKSYVDHYNKYKPDPNEPDKKEMFMFGISLFKKISTSDHEKAWLTFLTARQVLGGSKANILSGYSIIDSLPGTSNKYEEAMDIITCARTHGFSAVRLHQADIVLSELLVSSQLIVICQANGRGVATTIPGIYASGGIKTMSWQTIRQKSPEIKNGKVSFPETEDFYTADTFGYEYIPSCFDKKYKYLPSMRSADGYCIKTNFMNVNYVTSEVTLIERFSMAVYTRCQYAFTRVTFANLDPMRDFFIYGVVLERKGEKKDEVTGIEELMASYDSLTFSTSERQLWESNGAALAPFLKSTDVSSVFKSEEVPLSGKKITKSARIAAMKACIMDMKKNNMPEPDVKRIFYEYAVTNTLMRDLEIRDLFAPCDKVEVIGAFYNIFEWKKRITFDKMGTVTFKDKKFWGSLLVPLKTQPPPAAIVVPSVPPVIEQDEGDVYSDPTQGSILTVDE